MFRFRLPVINTIIYLVRGSICLSVILNIKYIIYHFRQYINLNGTKFQLSSIQILFGVFIIEFLLTTTEYLPSDWLAQYIPNKSPYFPQMGDEVMYIKQGHVGYINLVKTRNSYR